MTYAGLFMLARKVGFTTFEIESMDVGFLQDCIISETNAINQAREVRSGKPTQKGKVRKATQEDYDRL